MLPLVPFPPPPAPDVPPLTPLDPLPLAPLVLPEVPPAEPLDPLVPPDVPLGVPPVDEPLAPLVPPDVPPVDEPLVPEPTPPVGPDREVEGPTLAPLVRALSEVPALLLLVPLLVPLLLAPGPPLRSLRSHPTRAKPPTNRAPVTTDAKRLRIVDSWKRMLRWSLAPLGDPFAVVRRVRPASQAPFHGVWPRSLVPKCLKGVGEVFDQPTARMSCAT